MALPTSWQDMQRWLTLIACMEEAEILLASGQDVRAAQRLLQQQLRDAGLTETQFESTFMTLDADMEDAELQEYLEVCRIEIATADADAKEELQSLLVAEGFGDTHVEVMTAAVKAKAAVEAQTQKLALLDPSGSTVEKKTAEDSLATLTSAFELAMQGVHKAKRAKQNEDRKGVLTSPKKRQIRASIDSGDESATKSARQVTALHEPDASSQGLPPSQDAEQDVQRVLDGMLEDQVIIVKLFYAPYGVSQVGSKYLAGKSLDLYTTRVGAQGAEYELTARGEVAHEALRCFSGLEDKILRISHTKHQDFKGVPHLALMDNFAVQTVEQGHAELRKQCLKLVSIDELTGQKDKAYVNLMTCAVNMSSEAKMDKNGSPFRSTRVVDRRGMVSKVMVWGDIANKPGVWDKDTFVDIRAASVNVGDGRIDVRNCSQVQPAASSSTFKVPPRLSFAKW